MLSAQALGKIGSPKAIRGLRLASMDEEPKVADEARKALRKIPGGPGRAPDGGGRTAARRLRRRPLTEPRRGHGARW